MFTTSLLLVTAASAGDVHLQLLPATEVPIYVGGTLAAEFPYRLRAAGSVGVLPGPYLDLINSFVVAIGGYDDTTALIVDAALQDALVVRVEAGWRPIPTAGLHFLGGYQWVGLGGGLTSTEFIEGMTGTDLPPDSPAIELVAVAQLHMVTIEGLWEWGLWEDRVIVQAGIGGGFTLASKTEILPNEDRGRGQAADAAYDALLTAGEDYLDDIFTTYVHTPSVRVAIGYRFF